MQVLDSRVDDVTVYQAGARVRRSAQLVAPNVPTQVRIDGLPLALRERSLRVTVSGGALATDARLEVRIPPQRDDALADEPAAVRAARHALALCEGALARAAAALGALAKLAPVDAPRPPLGEPITGWRSALDARLAVAAWRRDRDRVLRAARTAAAAAVETARHDLAIAVDAAARGSSDRAPTAFEARRSAVITLHPGAAVADAPLTLTIEYAVEAARWIPTYVARLDDDGATLELRAAIAQATGEDWTAARLTLSTAAHQAWTELPELPSLRYGRAQPTPARTGFRAPPVGVEALYADWDAALRRPAAVEITSSRAAAPTTLRMEAQSFAGGGAAAAAEAADDEVEASMDFAMAAPSAPMAPPGAPMMPSGPRAMPPMAKKAMAPARLSAERTRTPRRQASDTAQFTGHRGATGEPITGDELLDYGALRLAGPDEPRRGHLVPPSGPDGVDALPAGAARFTFQAWLAEARERSANVQRLAPPQGSAPSWPARYDYAFAASAPLDVPSDGGWHNLPLRTVPIDLTMEHVVVPRESTDVFRVARLANPNPLPIIGGPLDVYLGGEFLLSTTVGFAPPRATFEVGLGVEPRIKVARNARFDEESAGMLRGALKLMHEITIDLTSVHPRPVRLEVRERVPVPPADAQSDDLSVAIDRVSHPWEPLPVDRAGGRVRGGHRWFVDLPAGAKASRSVSYHVKIPSKNELIGGNRREA